MRHQSLPFFEVRDLRFAERGAIRSCPFGGPAKPRFVGRGADAEIAREKIYLFARDSELSATIKSSAPKTCIFGALGKFYASAFLALFDIRG